MTPKIQAKLCRMRDGEFEGQVFVLEDHGNRVLVLLVPFSYDFRSEAFESDVRTRMLSVDARDQHGQLTVPALAWFNDSAMREAPATPALPQKLRLVGGEDD